MIVNVKYERVCGLLLFIVRTCKRRKKRYNVGVLEDFVMLIPKKEERLGEVRIDLGCKEFKFKDKLFEKNYRKVYDAGKYLRWDASDKTWDKHIKRLKEIHHPHHDTLSLISIFLYS